MFLMMIYMQIDGVLAVWSGLGRVPQHRQTRAAAQLDMRSEQPFNPSQHIT